MVVVRAAFESKDSGAWEAVHGDGDAVLLELCVSKDMWHATEGYDNEKDGIQTYIHSPPGQILDKVVLHSMMVNVIERRIVWIHSMSQ